MSKQITKELRLRISKAFARGNMEFAEAYLADSIKWNILGNDPLLGREQVLEVSKMLQLQSFPEITINNIVSEGDFVVVESTGNAQTKKGKPYNQAYCEVFRFDKDKIQEITTYLDTALSQQMLKIS